MKILLLLGVAIVMALESTTPPPAAEDGRSDPHDGYSLLSSLLQSAGYSDTCIANALDVCSSPVSAQEDCHFGSFIEEVRGIIQQFNVVLKTWISPPRNCKDLLDSGDSGSGLRQVYPFPRRSHHSVTVYCDHTVDGGGWTVLQRRANYTIRQDFYKGWEEYEEGFGDLHGEFWIGLKLLHQLTTIPQELRVHLHDYEGEHRWAKYRIFHVGDHNTNYTLTIGRYSGDAGDSMAFHNGSQFSTHDADHDKYPHNCVELYRGAWWYNGCHTSNLNGYQYEGEASPSGKGIVWYHWRGNDYSLRQTSMMIRPAL